MSDSDITLACDLQTAQLLNLDGICRVLRTVRGLHAELAALRRENEHLFRLNWDATRGWSIEKTETAALRTQLSVLRCELADEIKDRESLDSDKAEETKP